MLLAQQGLPIRAVFRRLLLKALSHHPVYWVCQHLRHLRGYRRSRLRASANGQLPRGITLVCFPRLFSMSMARWLSLVFPVQNSCGLSPTSFLVLWHSSGRDWCPRHPEICPGSQFGSLTPSLCWSQCPGTTSWIGHINEEVKCDHTDLIFKLS
jgi:hypothetical protein